MKKIKGLNVLERKDFERFAPSFYAEAPKSTMSGQYAFLNSRDIAKQLWQAGWMPTYAREKRSNKIENRGFNKHIVRFSHPDFVNRNGDRIELVSVNSHNGLSSYQFYAGVFRLVCTNGLIVQSSNLGNFRVIHKGNIQEQVAAAINGIAENAASIAGSIEDMQAIELTPNEQNVFATSAHEYVYGENDYHPIKPERLLNARRRIDQSNDLWTTYNVIQENLLKGGLRGYNRQTHRRVTTRTITSIDKDVKLNKALWAMAEQLKEHKQIVVNTDGSETEVTATKPSTDNDFKSLLDKVVANT